MMMSVRSDWFFFTHHGTATMTLSKTLAAALMATAVVAVLSLTSGATYLENVLPGGLPVGNALAALGVCAAAGTALALSARGTKLRAIAVASLIAAAAWLPVSIALAGNLALNFHGSRGSAWVVFSLGVLALVCGSLAWALASALLEKYRKPGPI